LSSIRHFAQRVRHLPILERCDWLWNTVRVPYQTLLDVGGSGVGVLMGGVRVQIPAEFAGGYWENYEPEVFRQAVNWIRANPEGLVLDLGCAVGVFSAAALFASGSSNVVAFDSDLASVVATRRFCRHAKGGRLQTVYGFVTDTSSVEDQILAGAIRQTDRFLHEASLSGKPGTTQYVNIATTKDKNVPRNTLDALFSGSPPRPILIKCDVEGAELLVLHGAQKLLTSHHPTLLLSVHPSILPDYGYVKEDVAKFLHEFGYTIDVISIDHEEHWWCR